MHAAPIDNLGTSLAYIDSGHVDSDTYNTLVCVHGYGYHAQNFKRLFPIAAKHNVRIVALNRRDYVGSTKYSSDEIEALHSGDAATLTAFMRARGLEIARFLAWFVTEHCIPPASKDGTSGGLALLGWSAGNVTTLAFLRHLDSYPSDVVATLEPYFRTLLIYDVSYIALGLPAPPDGGEYSPLRDFSIPERERNVVFGTWVSSYYEHPAPSSRKLSGLQLHTPQNPARAPTNETFSLADLRGCVDTAPGRRSELAFVSDLIQVPLLEQLRGALFDDARACVLPGVKVRMVYCMKSPWSIHWALWEVEKEMERWKNADVHGRPLRMIPVEDSNHFLHWDTPELALKTFVGAIRA